MTEDDRGRWQRMICADNTGQPKCEFNSVVVPRAEDLVTANERICKFVDDDNCRFTFVYGYRNKTGQKVRMNTDLTISFLGPRCGCRRQRNVGILEVCGLGHFSPLCLRFLFSLVWLLCCHIRMPEWKVQTQIPSQGISLSSYIFNQTNYAFF